MSRWHKKFVDHSYLVIKTLQQVFEDENNIKDRQQPKIQ